MEGNITLNLLSLLDWSTLNALLVLVACSLVLLGVLVLYLWELARATDWRHWLRFLLVALPLLVLAIWCISVDLGAQQLYTKVDLVNGIFWDGSHSPSLGPEIYVVHSGAFSNVYVFQLYSVLFLAFAGGVWLLRYALRLRLAFNALQAENQALMALGGSRSVDEEDLASGEEDLDEEYAEPEGYEVEVVVLGKVRQL